MLAFVPCDAHREFGGAAKLRVRAVHEGGQDSRSTSSPRSFSILIDL